MIKLLLADPDITFAIGIKRALEQLGGYQVTAFGSGQAALDFLRETRIDAAVIDYNLHDLKLEPLIKSLRETQPGLIILVTPRTGEQIRSLAALRVQGSIPKPYYARQLAPLLQEAFANRQKPHQPAPRPNLSVPPPSVTPPPPVSPDFDAAIASLPHLIVEPPVSPDDTFRRHLAAMLPEKPATPAGLRKTLEAVDLSGTPVSDEATIADVVSGKPLSDPPAPPTEAAPPDGPAAPSISEAALDALDTMPFRDFTVDGFTEKIEQTTGQPLPDWVHTTTEQTGMIEPAFVKAALEATPTEPLPPEIESVDPVAQIAAMLTQLSVGSAARATLLTRDEQLIAAAGDLGPGIPEGLAILIDSAWKAGDNAGSTLVRYISVPVLGDFLLYSTLSIDSMKLSMLFAADVPMKVIRKQARQLLDALEKPDAPAVGLADVRPEGQAEPLTPPQEAEKTLLSRPTDLRTPEGLRMVTAALPAPGSLPTVVAPVAMTSYGVAFIPRTGTFTPDEMTMASIWLTEAALNASWPVEGVETQSTYLTFQLSLPSTETPTAAVRRLMDATAEQAGRINLWSESYFITMPGRPVTQREITHFIGLQRSLSN